MMAKRCVQILYFMIPALVQANSPLSICSQVSHMEQFCFGESTVESQETPTILEGKVGKMGPRGPPGQDAVVDYSLIDGKIKLQLEALNITNKERNIDRIVNRENANLTNRFQNLEEKLSQFKNETTEHLEKSVELLKAQIWGNFTPLFRIISGSIGIRLVNGGSRNKGRVEVLHGGEWGTVCDDDWGINDANVVCRMLWYSKATEAAASARFGAGTGRIWLDQVSCSGSESTLSDCRHDTWGSNDCSHSEDAGVVCA